MKDNLIDESLKMYLVACLVSGIHVVDKPSRFMTGMVDHMNSLEERTFWATGDEDGVILHDKFDVPVLSLTYNGQELKFMMFESDPFLEQGINRDAGYMLLNILGYIRELGLEHEPVAFTVDQVVVSPKQTTTDDWSL